MWEKGWGDTLFGSDPRTPVTRNSGCVGRVIVNDPTFPPSTSPRRTLPDRGPLSVRPTLTLTLIQISPPKRDDLVE